MGAFLDKPKTEKYNECSEGAGLRYGLSSMQVRTDATDDLVTRRRWLLCSSMRVHSALTKEDDTVATGFYH